MLRLRSHHAYQRHRVEHTCKESTKLDRPVRSIRQALLLRAATRASPSTSFAKRAAPLEKPKYCFVREVGTLRLRQMTRWDFDVRR
jgi:hypothetical protein